MINENIKREYELNGFNGFCDFVEKISNCHSACEINVNNVCFYFNETQILSVELVIFHDDFMFYGWFRLVDFEFDLYDYDDFVQDIKLSINKLILDIDQGKKVRKNKIYLFKSQELKCIFVEYSATLKTYIFKKGVKKC